MKFAKKGVNYFLSVLFQALPFLFLCSTASNMAYLSVVALIPLSGEGWVSVGLHVLLFAVVLFYGLRWRSEFALVSSHKKLSVALFGVCFALFIIRTPLYYPTHDDLAFHIPAAFYSQSPFSSGNFNGIAQYKYPALNQNYTPFLASIGIRATLLLSGFLLSIWVVSLASRFTELMPEKSPKLIFITFVGFFYFPLLVATHATFMTDVWSALICLEAFYQFLKFKSLPTKSNLSSATLVIIFVVMSILTKQSVVVFSPFWLFICLSVFWSLKKQLQEFKQWLKFILPVLIFIGVSSFYFIRVTLEEMHLVQLDISGESTSQIFNKLSGSWYVHQLRHSESSDFGPRSALEAITWPIIGSFTSRYTEIYISWYANIFLVLVSGFAYLYCLLQSSSALLSRRGIFTSRFYFSITVVATYFFWSLYSGYGRYIAPLHFIVLIWIIFDNPASLHKILITFLAKKNVSRFIFLMSVISVALSLKSDYSWRPYPSLKNSQSTSYFLSEYAAGLKLFFNDNVYQIADKYTVLWDAVDGSLTTSYGENNFINFLGALKGKPVLENITSQDEIKYRSSGKTNKQYENTFKLLSSINNFIVVTDLFTQDLVPLLYATQNFECHTLPNDFLTPIQANSLSDLILVMCRRKGLPMVNSGLEAQPTDADNLESPMVSNIPSSTRLRYQPKYQIELNQDELLKQIKKSSYINCSGDSITESLVAEDKINLIKENVRYGRLIDVCVVPKYFVVHWAGAWLDASTIKGVVEGNGSSCQLATDKDGVWALMKFYSDRVERAACTGRNSNFVALNNELSGVCFNQVLAGKLAPDSIPDQAYVDFNQDVEAICDHFAQNTTEGKDSKYTQITVRNHTQELLKISDLAVENACQVRLQYKIPVQSFIGHYDVPKEYLKYPKFDPGSEYMEYFRDRLFESCPMSGDVAVRSESG